MIRKITTYKVRGDKLREVEQAIVEFVASIGENEPRTFYAAYRTDEENTYFHIMEFPDAQAEAYHQKAPHTMKFVDVLYPNCEVQPHFMELTLLESTSSAD
ncbi:MAG TPA: antibiotic biosynthesis monooxygenase [Anaerolineales bacterium]|nr:antibiotic biosynthesis monooxygenase [Anaerolineales bacterium]